MVRIPSSESGYLGLRKALTHTKGEQRVGRLPPVLLLRRTHNGTGGKTTRGMAGTKLVKSEFATTPAEIGKHRRSNCLESHTLEENVPGHAGMKDLYRVGGVRRARRLMPAQLPAQEDHHIKEVG